MIRLLKKKDIKGIIGFARKTRKFRKKELIDLRDSLEAALEPDGDFYKVECYVEQGQVKG